MSSICQNANDLFSVDAKVNSINRIKGLKIKKKTRIYEVTLFKLMWMSYVSITTHCTRETSTSSFNLMIMRVHSSTLSIRQHASLTRWELEMSIICFLLHCIAYYEEKSSLDIKKSSRWKGKKNDWDFTWTTFSISPWRLSLRQPAAFCDACAWCFRPFCGENAQLTTSPCSYSDMLTPFSMLTCFVVIVVAAPYTVYGPPAEREIASRRGKS